MDKRTTQLEEADIKKLRRRRLFMQIFFVYMAIVATAMLAFGLWVKYDKGDDQIALFLSIGSLIAWIVPFSMWRNAQKITRDLNAGLKFIIQGVVTKRYRYKKRFELTINDQVFRTNYEYYSSVKKGDNVLVGFAPNAKIILNISKIQMDEVEPADNPT